MSLQSLGEFGLIRRLTRIIPRKNKRLRTGIGDDCAVIRQDRSWDLLVTTDLLIDGVHFRSGGSSPFEIGFKAFRVNLSDIAAMGGVPRWALIAVGLPKKMEIRAVERLFSGIRRGAEPAGVVLVGGDTNRSSKLVISITLVGEVARGEAILRRGARPGAWCGIWDVFWRRVGWGPNSGSINSPVAPPWPQNSPGERSTSCFLPCRPASKYRRKSMESQSPSWVK